MIRYVGSQPAGGTDCALPMVWATANQVEVDTFVVYTDGETWAGVMHVDQALEQYRQAMGRDASSGGRGHDGHRHQPVRPEGPWLMDISGFDSQCPQLISDFSAGQL